MGVWGNVQQGGAMYSRVGPKASLQTVWELRRRMVLFCDSIVGVQHSSPLTSVVRREVAHCTKLFRCEAESKSECSQWRYSSPYSVRRSRLITENAGSQQLKPSYLLHFYLNSLTALYEICNVTLMKEAKLSLNTLFKSPLLCRLRTEVSCLITFTAV